MSSTLLIHTTPEELAELIHEKVKSHFQNLKKEIADKKANDELLTREETCKFLQIDSSTLWNWTNKGKVQAYGIGNRRYYKRSELLDCLTLLKK